MDNAFSRFIGSEGGCEHQHEANQDSDVAFLRDEIGDN